MLASNGAAGDEFGNGVSISGDVALVAAAGSSLSYIFRWNGSTWLEEQKLFPSDGKVSESVSISSV